MVKPKVTRLTDGQFRVRVNARDTAVHVDHYNAFDQRVIDGLRYAADALAVYDEAGA